MSRMHTLLNKLHINRLTLAIVVAISIILPAVAGSPTFAMSSMDDMGHSNVDIVSCMNQHQVPTPPTAKEIDQLKNEDDDGVPQELPYYLGLSTNYGEPKKQKTNLIASSSFRPPDIVILTSNLRI
ncbi:hypothetical protein JNM87_06200 [Candidatus Saccharibacteria bacterium]|nr:hypothetical protein [Candidatus Saccharibacteria bacterium]